MYQFYMATLCQYLKSDTISVELIYFSVMLVLLSLEFWDGGRGQRKADMKNKPSVR